MGRTRARTWSSSSSPTRRRRDSATTPSPPESCSTRSGSRTANPPIARTSTLASRTSPTKSSTLPSSVSSALSLPRAEREQLYLLQTEQLRRSGVGLFDWARAFRFEKSRPLDFERFPFQVEMHHVFGDRGVPAVDVMKSAQ